MRICLVAGSSLEWAPYVAKYRALCREAGVACDVVSKRHVDARAEAADSEKIFYYQTAKTPLGQWRRFAAYADFAAAVLREGRYDGAVVFGAMNGAFLRLRHAAVLRDLRYIADIRDRDRSVSLPLLSRAFGTFVRGAEALVISSPKFAAWVPGGARALVMHNLPADTEGAAHTAAFTAERIRVAYFGKIDYLPQNKALVNALRADSGIELVYRGLYPPTYSIRDYCREAKVPNAVFYDAYKEEEKAALYREVDLINAVYGNKNPVVTSALPNKLYDAAVYRIPLMVNEGTYLAEVTARYGLGFAVDPFRDDVCARIHRYAETFDAAAFERGCAAFLAQAKEEQARTLATLRAFMGGNT